MSIDFGMNGTFFLFPGADVCSSEKHDAMLEPRSDWQAVPWISLDHLQMRLPCDKTKILMHSTVDPEKVWHGLVATYQAFHVDSSRHIALT